MKTLIVYTKDSYYKYNDIYLLHCFHVNENNILTVTRRNLETGEEKDFACFKEWEYFRIEEDND